MNAKVVIYLLISAFVLSGCASFKAKLQEAKEAEYAKLDPDKAEREKFFAKCDAFMQQCEADRKETEKHIKEFGEVQSEFLAWYDSLSVEQKTVLNRDLEEKQIRYNQIHGFNPDGSSRYLNPEGDYWTDRLDLMAYYKTIWDH